MSEALRHGASFRDPSGFVFWRDGDIYRQVAKSFTPEFELILKSGLLEDLIQDRLLLPFEVVDLSLKQNADAGMVLQPVQLDWISYPYEWGFGQWKDAALCTLENCRRALEAGYILKDASSFNIQFYRGKPILIDTLSFEPYEEGKPWIAYRQFCQHFLAPLALMAYIDPRLGTMLRCHTDGIPLDLAAKMLPNKAKWSFGVRTHIELHSRANSASQTGPARPMSKLALRALLDSLKRTVESLRWEPRGTEWADYYSDTNYSHTAEGAKRGIVQTFLQQVPDSAKTCWDLGANDGSFSRLALQRGLLTVGWDIDRGAVENGYRWALGEQREDYLPLTLDLTNPSPSIGWSLKERESFLARGPVDVVLALALIHHLSIGNNVPLSLIADFFAEIGKWVIVEFVPTTDSQVQKMLVARKNIFGDYDIEHFESAFQTHFEIVAKRAVADSQRTIYLLRRSD
jgi:hypothetical protein